MKIYLMAKIAIFIFALLATSAVAITADDDEVDASFPGYPFKIYSGNRPIMQDTLLWV